MKSEFIYMEDCFKGQTFTAGPITVTEAEIIAFAEKYDPQNFHTDPEKAKKTAFGRLVASGWHTASITMRMIVAASPKMEGGMIGRGITNLEWPRPVLPGDTLTYTGEILDIRPSAKNPARGTLHIKNTTRNQHGEIVLQSESFVMIPRRG